MNNFTDAIYFKTPDRLSNFSEATKSANTVANFFLSPIRYLANGYSVQCLEAEVKRGGESLKFSQVEHPNRKGVPGFFIGAVAIILFIPGTIIGVLFKGSALICSKNLRECYQIFHAKLDEDSVAFKTSSKSQEILNPQKQDKGSSSSIEKPLHKPNKIH